MGSEVAKFNNETNMSVDIELNKACYFPEEMIYGKITLYPFLQSFEKIMENPNFNITINQLQHYVYSTGTGKNRHTVSVNEDIVLLTVNVNFKSVIKTDYSSGFIVPIRLQIPKNAYPSLVATNASVKHYFVVDIPHTKTIRTKLFFIKSFFPNNIDGTLLRPMVAETKEFKKSNFLAKKGSCLVSLKLPKNYFYYDEQIPFEINLDCSKLEMNIKSIGVILQRRTHKNNKEDHSISARTAHDDINKKVINLEKGLSRYDISDFLLFPFISEYNSVYPPNVYKQFDEHGLFEINDPNFNYRLYPNCLYGLILISIDYFVKVELYFDCTFTYDEELLIPIYFGHKMENNEINSGMTNKGIGNSIPYCSYYYKNNNNNNNSINNSINTTINDSINTNNTLTP